MQTLEFMRPFTGDLSRNPSLEEASLAYTLLSEYIRKRHREHALHVSTAVTITDYIEDTLHLDVDGTLVELEESTSPENLIRLTATIYVPEGKHLYITDPMPEQVRRIDRPDEVEAMVDEAMAEASRTEGPLGALKVLADMLLRDDPAEALGLNNQPIDTNEAKGLISFMSPGVPVAAQRG